MPKRTTPFQVLTLIDLGQISRFAHRQARSATKELIRDEAVMTNVVEQLATILGTDTRHQVLHTRGTWIQGSFVGADKAQALTDASVFGGKVEPVVGRFSGNRGALTGHDADTGDQGLAIRIGEGAHSMDLMMFTLPVFFVRTGADLVDFLAAVSADQAGVVDGKAHLAQYIAEHPETHAALSLAPEGVAASYLGQTYHAVHAYGLSTLKTREWVRLLLEPVTTTPRLDAGKAQAQPHNYLSANLEKGLPAHFYLEAQHPTFDDAVHDPTAVWAGQRRTRLGALRIEAVDGPSGDKPQFDPLHLPSGVHAPQDQLSRDRSDAYRIARCLRSQGASQGTT